MKVPVSYTVERSKRRTIALVITDATQVIVKAPQATTIEEIETIVAKKLRWIKEKQNLITVFEERHTPLILGTGESILYLGNSYTILIKKIDSITIDGTYIMIPVSYVKEDLVKWLKSEAKKIIAQRIDRYANIMGTPPKQTKLSDAVKRWGSCSPSGNIQLSWRLVMCPLFAIDYVIVHELSHLTYRNHGGLFWARIATMLPDYKSTQEWLKINRKLIAVE